MNRLHTDSWTPYCGLVDPSDSSLRTKEHVLSVTPPKAEQLRSCLAAGLEGPREEGGEGQTGRTPGPREGRAQQATQPGFTSLLQGPQAAVVFSVGDSPG